MREQAIQEVLDKALDGLPPEVAAEVQRRWDADQEAFSQAAMDNVPSKDPRYWATRNCKHCYGRGTTGTARYADGREQTLVCRCIERNYQRWLVSFRRYYNELRVISRSNGYEG